MIILIVYIVQQFVKQMHIKNGEYWHQISHSQSEPEPGERLEPILELKH